MSKTMKIKKIDYDFSICKLQSGATVDLEAKYCFAGKTDEELSLVCITENAPENTIDRDDGWRAFRIDGILDFSLVGILAEISGILADNGIGIFAVSTFNTDYILTKAENYEKALSLLEAEGYEIIL